MVSTAPVPKGLSTQILLGESVPKTIEVISVAPSTFSIWDLHPLLEYDAGARITGFKGLRVRVRGLRMRKMENDMDSDFCLHGVYRGGM